MKKELLAGIFLIVILIGSMVNIWYLSSLSDELITLIETVEKQASEKNWDNAAEKSESAMELWKKNNVYLSIVLPNETIDNVTESLHELRKEIDTENTDSVSWTAQLAVTQLENTVSAEQVNFESVF